MRAKLADETKGFNCGECQQRYFDTHGSMKPACWKESNRHPWGNACPVYDVAPDIELNRMAAAFVQFDLLDLSPGAGPIQAKLLKDSGLIEESADTILELKSILAEYRNKASKQEADSQKAASIRRRARG